MWFVSLLSFSSLPPFLLHTHTHTHTHSHIYITVLKRFFPHPITLYLLPWFPELLFTRAVYFVIANTVTLAWSTCVNTPSHVGHIYALYECLLIPVFRHLTVLLILFSVTCFLTLWGDENTNRRAKHTHLQVHTPTQCASTHTEHCCFWAYWHCGLSVSLFTLSTCTVAWHVCVQLGNVYM